MRIPVALFLLALLVRAILIALFPHAAYPDSYYYADVANSLLAGHGFNIDFIWNFVDVGGRLPAQPVLPIPSDAHWMPLAAIVQLPGLWLFGSSGVAAALPFAVAGATVAPLTWLVAREAGARPAVSIGAGIMGAIPAATAIYMVQPDGFALYQPLGLAVLWLAARGLKGDGRSFALAGLMAGLATLTRNDGVLLAALLGLAFLWSRWQTRHGEAGAGDGMGAKVGRGGVRRVGWRAAVLCGALFLLAVAPWYARQMAVFGSFSPSASSGRILFISSYEQLFSITSNTSLGAFLGQGIGPLLTSRLLGLVSAVAVFSIEVCPVVLMPFVVAGAWARRRSVDFGPWLTYAALLFGANALLFAVHVPYGTFMHSAVALAPQAYIVGLEGVAIAVGWIARRRRSWNEAQATRVFIAAGVGTAVLTAAFFGGARILPSWSHERDIRLSAGAALAALHAPASDRLMTADPGGFEYLIGHGGVVTPEDPLDTIRTVARAYDVRWLVLERDHIVAALGPVLIGRTRPSWIGPAVFSVPSSDAASAGGIPELALYPVCFEPADSRCSSTAGSAGSGARSQPAAPRVATPETPGTPPAS